MTQMGDSIRRRSGRGRRPRARTNGGASGPGLDWTRWILWGLGSAAVAFLLGWVIATQVLFPKPALARDEVAVPDLTGMTVDEVRETLSVTRLEVGRVREMVHPTARRGEVVAQDPVSGQRLRPGAEVRVAVSRGRARVLVPDLVGMPVEAAVELARRVGFEPERMEEPTIEAAGTVLRTNPAAGTQSELPAELIIVVSAGGIEPPPDTTVVAPDSGLVEDAGDKMLRDGLEPGTDD